jgi:hypothetical protein
MEGGKLPPRGFGFRDPPLSGGRSFTSCMEISAMSEITLSTTVEELVASFSFSSISQLEAHLKKFGKKSSGGSDPQVQEYMDRIAELVLKRKSETMPYKTGGLVAMLDGIVKSSDPVLEAERKRVHSLIGKALKGLAELAFLDKRCNGNNHAHTYYVWTGAEYGDSPKSEEQETETQASDSGEEIKTEEVKTESVEESKPKARVRRKNKA